MLLQTLNTQDRDEIHLPNLRRPIRDWLHLEMNTQGYGGRSE